MLTIRASKFHFPKKREEFYLNGPLYNDIAIIELQKPMEEFVPIALPYNTFEHYSIEQSLVFNGYGVQYHENEIQVQSGKICAYNIFAEFYGDNTFILNGVILSKQIFEMALPSLDYKIFPYFCSNFNAQEVICKNYYKLLIYIKRNCLFQGDSGGPLMLQVSQDKWFLVGIAI